MLRRNKYGELVDTDEEFAKAGAEMARQGGIGNQQMRDAEQFKQDTINTTQKENQQSVNATNRANNADTIFGQMEVQDSVNKTNINIVDKNNTALAGVRASEARYRNSGADSIDFENGVNKQLRNTIVAQKRSALDKDKFSNQYTQADIIRRSIARGDDASPEGIKNSVYDFTTGAADRINRIAKPDTARAEAEDKVDTVARVAKYKQLSEHQPFGVRTSGADNNRFVSDIKAITGEEPDTLLDSIMTRAIPFAAANRALKYKNKSGVVSTYNNLKSLATPK